MSNALFLHASLNTKNLLDRDSLILQKIASSKNAMEYLLSNLLKSTTIEKFYVVTSDSSVDDPIEKIVKDFNDERIDIIRITSGAQHSIDDNNFVINTNFTFRNPYYGFFGAEYCINFCKKNYITLAVILQADYFILLSHTFLDLLVEQCSQKGDIFIFGNTSIPIIISPVKEIEALYINQNSKKKKLIEHMVRTIEDDSDFLQKNHSITLNIEAKKNNIEKKYKNPFHIKDLFVVRDSLEGIVRKSISEQFPGKEMQFYPLLTKNQLEKIREIIASSKELTLENFFDKEKEFCEETFTAYPGYLEVELTNRCNLKCKNCPNTVLKRKKTDISDDNYKSIIDITSSNVPMICLSGYGEPVLHEKLISFIRYAKENGFFRVALETNGSLLDDKIILSLIDAGLDILILNLDALDLYSDKGSDELIERILDARGSSLKPYIVLQTVNNINKQKKIDYYFRRWQHMVDKVLILPFNDFLETFAEDGLIDFTPPRENISTCKKTFLSSLVLSDGKLAFCKQFFDGNNNGSDKSFLQLWQENRHQGLKKDFCKNCSLWYQLDIPSFTDFNSYQSSFFEDIIYNILIHNVIEKGAKYYDQKDFENALEEWEKVLRFDPSNEFIHSKLDELLKEFTPENE